MIFLSERGASGSIAGWIETPRRAHELADRMRVLVWEDLVDDPVLPAEVAILNDTERLYPAQRELASRVWRALGEAGVPRLNDPDRVLGRAALLDRLHREGLNAFRAVGAGDTLDGLRYPVFVREANEHTGTLTGLLDDPARLRRALTVLTRLGGFSRDELLVVEFCDTVDPDGSYRKYSAIRLGDHTLARALTFSRRWMVKDDNRVIDEAIVAKEREFIETHPHRDWVERVFDLAGIDYGRIDYGVLDGRPQAWEINTNPQVGPRARRDGGPRKRNRGYWLRQEAKEIFHTAFRDLLRELDATGPREAAPIPIPIDPDLVRRLRADDRRRRRRDRVRGAFHRLRYSAPLRRVVRIAART